MTGNTSLPIPRRNANSSVDLEFKFSYIFIDTICHALISGCTHLPWLLGRQRSQLYGLVIRHLFEFQIHPVEKKTDNSLRDSLNKETSHDFIYVKSWGYVLIKRTHFSLHPLKFFIKVRDRINTMRITTHLATFFLLQKLITSELRPP